jgi:microcystin-dependent protein
MKSKIVKPNKRKIQKNFTQTRFPIGSVVYYAGDLSAPVSKQALKDAGWLICNGEACSTEEYPELAEAIKYANGGAGSTFYLPDLRDRFMRGTLGNSPNKTDPDANQRIAAIAGGNSGNKTGSLQKTATGKPKAAWILQEAGEHKHYCAHLDSGMKKAFDGSNAELIKEVKTATTKEAGAHQHNLSGFDAVTVPKRIALYFIIKAKELLPLTGTTPCGAIVGFAGELATIPDNWLRCDGQTQHYNTSRELFEAISTNYGGEDIQFNVPELRGYFLRGTNHGRKIDSINIDPGADDRHELNPGGNEADRIGSAQYYATKCPTDCKVETAGAHSHKLANVPGETHDVADAAGGTPCVRWTDNSTASTDSGIHSHVVSGGGDNETRPENIYVDFLISNTLMSNSAPPIGTIMSFGGDITDQETRKELARYGWLPCDGSFARRSEYEELANVIGSLYGNGPTDLSSQNKDSDLFTLPDLFGFFVTGVGKMTIGQKSLESTTGVPNTPFTTSIEGIHRHDFSTVPSLKFVSTWIPAGITFGKYSTAEKDTTTDDDHTHTLTGADSESRPVNVYVDFIIRGK